MYDFHRSSLADEGFYRYHLGVKLGKLSFLLGLVLALSSCLSTETSISVSASGAGEIRYEYSISADAVYLGVFDRDSSILTIPVHRSDFETMARLSEDLELRSYAMSERDGRIRVVADLSFTSIDGFNAAYNRGRDSLILDGTESSGSARLRIFGGFGEPVDRTFQEFASQTAESLAYSLRLPGPVLSTNHGEYSGRTAFVRFSIEELLETTEPVDWIVTW